VTKAASQIDVDVVCMDCEDAVAMSRKQEARDCVAGYLESK
jgi:citrate lyase beta subunit